MKILLKAILGSQAYQLAFHLGLPCIWFDKAREQVLVSATKIRQMPFDYWDIDEAIITKIGKRQTALVKERMAITNKFLFCGTDLMHARLNM